MMILLLCGLFTPLGGKIDATPHDFLAADHVTIHVTDAATVLAACPDAIYHDDTLLVVPCHGWQTLHQMHALETLPAVQTIRPLAGFQFTTKLEEHRPRTTPWIKILFITLGAFL